MHDARTLLELGPVAESGLSRRQVVLDLNLLRHLVRRRSEILAATQRLRREARSLARGGRPAAGRSERATEVREQIRKLETELTLVADELTEYLLTIPNLPADAIPSGHTEDAAVEVRRVGEPGPGGFAVRDHAEIGESLGILDARRAAKLSGARFAVVRGAGAVLERALTAFFLDLHTREHGYLEYSVPALVNRQTMTGTGQLPKFEQELFRTTVGDRELFLIPTAEVPLTNLYAGETVDEAALPLALTAYTRCFRAEAGSYGRDTRGIMRLHEFGKVELVRLCAPDQSWDELTLLLGHAEECLRRLGLAYRVVMLPAGDLGFAARVTYDIEVWVPSQNRYREISSCTDCGTFQARRAGIRMRRRGGATAHVATLNGSGLPIGRTVLAILEQCQQPDGSVEIPAALIPYTAFRRIAPDGTPEP